MSKAKAKSGAVLLASNGICGAASYSMTGLDMISEKILKRKTRDD